MFFDRTVVIAGNLTKDGMVMATVFNLVDYQDLSWIEVMFSYQINVAQLQRIIKLNESEQITLLRRKPLAAAIDPG